MGFVVVMIVFAILMFCITIFQFVSENKEQKERMEKFQKKMDACGYDLKIESGNTKIYINEKAKMWTVACDDKFYKFKDVLMCEILENNTSVISTVSKKHVSMGKALVGGALLGPTGAIIGGTSGKITSNSEQQETCNNLKIKVTLNNLEQPCKFIDLINSSTMKNSMLYKEKFEVAQKIVSLFQIMINSK